MRKIRVIVLIIAGVSGIATMAVVKSALDNNKTVEVVTQREEIKVTEKIARQEVLVSTRDMKMGEPFTPETLSWQVWPSDSIGPSFITRSANPNARDTMQRVVVRNYVVAGEPITEAKMLNLDNASVMSVLLRDGMRAISVKIAPETGAGGFILPGDYVDVLLTTRNTTNNGFSGGQAISSHPVLERVRVLAIDQIFDETNENNAAAVGRTATLEVLPEQTTVLTSAEEAGLVTLTLRSLSEILDADGNIIVDSVPVTVNKKNTGPSVVVLRNGQATKVIPQSE